MTRYVADTHALFWYLTNSPKLGPEASRIFDENELGTASILVPAIVVAELYFVNEKLGRPFDFAQTLEEMNDADRFGMIPLGSEDVLDFDPDGSVPEMHDRIIVGVARRAGAICLTRDRSIVTSGRVPTLW